jgi:hypothetical protein
MSESPYRSIENPPEETVLNRFKEMFGDKKSAYETRYVASNSYGFGYITALSEKDKKTEAEANEYTLKIGQSKKPVTVTVHERPEGVILRGFTGWESAGEKLDNHDILEIFNEIRLAKELEPAEKLDGSKEQRARLVKKILKKGNRSGHNTVSNVTKNGFLTVERNHHGTIAFLVDGINKQELAFFVGPDGGITKIVKLIGRGQVHPRNLDIHRIHSTYISGEEMTPGEKNYDEAIRRLDENLETFKLPHMPETGFDEEKKIRNDVRGKIDHL